MKKAADPRHQMRIHIVEELFAQSFTKQKLKQARTQAVVNNLPTIDQIIAKAAPAWSLSKIAKIDLAILRLSVFELVIDKKEPVKVIIDEAVEIAKAYGNDRSPPFINGVLGTILKSI